MFLSFCYLTTGTFIYLIVYCIYLFDTYISSIYIDLDLYSTLILSLPAFCIPVVRFKIPLNSDALNTGTVTESTELVYQSLIMMLTGMPYILT